MKILRQIRDEIVSLRADTNSRLDELRSDVDLLRSETAAGLARHEQALAKLVRQGEDLATRFDNFLTGSHHEAHEELRRGHDRLEARLDRLEERVGRD